MGPATHPDEPDETGSLRMSPFPPESTFLTLAQLMFEADQREPDSSGLPLVGLGH